MKFERRGKENLELKGREWLNIRGKSGNKWGCSTRAGVWKWDMEQGHSYPLKESGSKRSKKGSKIFKTP